MSRPPRFSKKTTSPIDLKGITPENDRHTCLQTESSLNPNDRYICRCCICSFLLVIISNPMSHKYVIRGLHSYSHNTHTRALSHPITSLSTDLLTSFPKSNGTHRWRRKCLCELITNHRLVRCFLTSSDGSIMCRCACKHIMCVTAKVLMFGLGNAMFDTLSNCACKR